MPQKKAVERVLRSHVNPTKTLEKKFSGKFNCLTFVKRVICDCSMEDEVRHAHPIARFLQPLPRDLFNTFGQVTRHH
jgi:hypothetical protein